MNEGWLNFPLPYNQGESFWLCALLPESAAESLRAQGFDYADGSWRKRTDRFWNKEWATLRDLLAAAGTLKDAEISVLQDTGSDPSPEDIRFHRKHADVIDRIAGSLWLGEALLERRVTCYLQKVVNARGETMGYESFARLPQPGAETIGGGKIIHAARVLGIEYGLDRYLHVEAIRHFAAQQARGFLFVNFMPGFIHRPAVYLEGLTATVEAHGLPHKRIVLDFTQSEDTRDPKHLKAVVEYCRSKGYSAALDDIELPETAKRLLQEITPDFLKLDMRLIRQAEAEDARAVIVQLVELAHARGATVIAEGVENQAIFEALRASGVDLFQGYYFGEPSAQATHLQEVS